MYFFRTTWVQRAIYPECMWRIPSEQNALYLTFDDGPTPEVTDFVLDKLQVFNAKATFFMIGANFLNHTHVAARVSEAGHTVGNHTMTHVNGWKTGRKAYWEEYAECQKALKDRGLNSKLFRPPYGRVTRSQVREIGRESKVVGWSCLSGDFDKKVNINQAWRSLKRSRSGDILLFHDSNQAFNQLKVLLPKTLKYFSEKGFKFKAIPCD